MALYNTLLKGRKVLAFNRSFLDIFVQIWNEVTKISKLEVLYKLCCCCCCLYVDTSFLKMHFHCIAFEMYCSCNNALNWNIFTRPGKSEKKKKAFLISITRSFLSLCNFLDASVYRQKKAIHTIHTYYVHTCVHLFLSLPAELFLWAYSLAKAQPGS